MSAAVKEEIDTVHCCASCGVAGVDDINLKDCDDCNLVKYCSDECKKDHRPHHEEECKKRVAELRDELLFKQPESNHYGDCPICCLPLPLDISKSVCYSCCSKRICDGCNYANQERENERRLQKKCPFCRKPLPDTDEDIINERWMKRIEANDPDAICDMGTRRYHEGDYDAAFEYLTKAAALGDVVGHYHLSCLYGEGKGVVKDKRRALHHAEKAAIAGHPYARHNLGCWEEESGKVDRAAKHWIIAAKLGFDRSLECIKDLYKDGLVSKEDFEAALRGHHAAIVATKSPQREEAYDSSTAIKICGLVS